MRFERKEKATVKRAITFTPRRQKEEYGRVVRGNVEGGKAGRGGKVDKESKRRRKRGSSAGSLGPRTGIGKRTSYKIEFFSHDEVNILDEVEYCVHCSGHKRYLQNRGQKIKQSSHKQH